MSNPLVAQKQDSTTWHSGINVLDDAAGVYQGVQSGSWVEGGIAALGTGMDLLTMAMNPVGTLISYGLNWLIEHVKPLQDALNQLAGDADQIAAYSQTWKNVAQAVRQAGKDLVATVDKDTANWAGAAADAYRANIKTKIDHINAAATCAETISTVVQIVGVVTGAVRGMVRDMVTQAVGDFVQDALEEVCSLGLGTPAVVAQVVEQVSAWLEKIGALIKKLINSVEALRPMMSKLEEIFAAIKKVMAELHGHPGEAEPHVSGDGSTHASSADAPNAPGGEEPRAAGGDGTHAAGDDATAPSNAPAEPSSPRSPGDSEPGSIDNTDPAANSKTNTDTKATDDPIDLATGRVFLDQTDVELPGVLPFTLTRGHRSDFQGGRSFGPGWSSTIDQRVQVDGGQLHFAAADGMLLTYPAPRQGESILPTHGTPWPLSRTDDGGFAITNGQLGQTLLFAATGGRHRPIVAITDRNGNRIDFRYDDSGQLTEIGHSGGYRLLVSTTDGLVTELRLTDPAGHEVPLTRYRYDSRRRLVEVVNSSNLPTLFEYDAAGRLTRWVDRNGMWYRYTYDENGRCIGAEGRDGFLNCTVEYDTGNRITSFTNSLGHTTIYRLNDEHQIVAETDPLGNTTTFEWNRRHQLLSRTDPLGRTARYAYDDNGNLTVLTRADGHRATAEYNELNLPTTMTDPDGAVWRYEYDQYGNLLAATDPAGARTTYTYAGHGHLASVTDAHGSVRHVHTNGAGLPIAVTDPAGAVSRYERDMFGRVHTMVDPLGNSTRYGWNVEGKLIWRTLPDGATSRWSYDAEGNLREYVDEIGQVTRFEVTQFDLPVTQIAPDGARTRFDYDTELRLVRVTNPQGLSWHYEYDGAGNLLRETDFSGRTLNYRYDAAGRLTERINGAGQIIRYTHDEFGRVVRKESGETVSTFGYDPAGRLVSATHQDTELTIEYDPSGNVVSEAIDGRAVYSEYDSLGRRTVRRTPSGVESRWEYDQNDQPVSLSVDGQPIRFCHDALGREVRRQIGESVLLDQTWDANGRLHVQAISAGTPNARGTRGPRLVQRRAYTYRNDGYLTGLVDPTGGLREFDLDPAGRVTAVRGATWTENYSYDPAGNISAAAWPGPVASAPTDASGSREYAGTLIRRAGNVRYHHDAQGRVVLRQQKRLSAKPLNWHYEWDADDRLAGVTTPDGQRWRYTYDALGRRVAKRRLAPDGTGTLEQVQFTWDGNTLVEQEHAHGGNAPRITTWEWAPDGIRPLAQTERSALRDRPQEYFDARFYAIITDLTDTPAELVDLGGEVVWHATRSLWGAPLRHSQGDVDTPLRFPGQYFDPETQLNYNYQRYYDPQIGEYLRVDPLGLQGGFSPSRYVPNPTAWTDPSGLLACRKQWRLDDGNEKEGWQHIQGRHIDGTIPAKPGEPSDMLPSGTTREQVEAGAKQLVQKGTRISDPARRIQTLEGRGTVNGMHARFRVIVDSHDGNRIITFFPVGKST